MAVRRSLLFRLERRRCHHAAFPDQVIRKRRIRAIIFISSNIVPLTILIIIPGDYFQPQPMPETLRLEDAVEFAENPEPRCPCILLLDISGSMQGERINALNEGLRTFKEELNRDSLANKRVEVAIVTFNTDVQVVQDLSQLTSSSHRC